MNVFKGFLLTTAAIAVLAGCGRDEPAVVTPVAVAPAQTPIYAKDGTVIGMRPTVMPGGMSMDADMDDDDMDDINDG